MLNIDDRLIKETSPKIGANALSVLLAIAIHLNQKTNRCFPSHFRLMELTGLGRDAVYKALNVLQEKCLLKSTQKMGGRANISRREFRLTTDFINIFVAVKEFTLPENTDTINTDTENTDTIIQETEHINKSQQINEFEQINESEHAPAKAENSNDLNTEKNLSIGAGAAPLSPGWNDYPKADTPDELKAELSRFYQARPEDWRMTKEATPAQNWTKAQTETVVSKFCDWAIGEGWEKRTFKQINARLKRWFKEEPLMQPKPHRAPQTIQEPRGAAYQPIPKDY